MPSIRLRIRGRLYAGFTALVVVGLVMAVVAVWNLWAVQGQMATTVRAFRTTSSRVQEISIHLQAMQRANLRYIYDANEPAFKEAAEREAATAGAAEGGGQVDGLRGAAQDLQWSRRRHRQDEVPARAHGRCRQRDDERQGDSARRRRRAHRHHRQAGRGRACNRRSPASPPPSPISNPRSSWFVSRTGVSSPSAIQRVRRPSGPISIGRSNGLTSLEEAGLPDEVKAAFGPIKTSLADLQEGVRDDVHRDPPGRRDLPQQHRPPDREASTGSRCAETGLKADYQKSRTTADGVIASTTWIQEVAGGLAILFGCIVAFLIARSIVGPLTSDDPGDGARSPVAISRSRFPAAGNATRSATWPRRSRCSRTTWSRPSVCATTRTRSRCGRPRAARPTWSGSPTSSSRRSARSSTPCRRHQTSSKSPPAP